MTASSARPSSLGSRIVLTSLALTLVMVSSSLLVSWLVLSHMLNRETEQAYQSLAVLLSNNLDQALVTDSRASVRKALSGLFQLDDVTFAAVLTADGTVVAQMGDPPPQPLQSEVPVQTTVVRSGRFLLVQAPIRDAALHPVGTLHLGYSMGRLQANLKRGLLLLFVLGLGLAIAAGLVGQVQARRLTAHLVDLARAADRLGEGRAPELLGIQRNDEVGQVARAFTEMSRRLEESRRQIEVHNRELEGNVRQRTEELRRKNVALAVQNERILEVSRLKSAFLANMSHELRTPLNAILALSELLRDEITGPLSNEEQKRQVEMIHQSGTSLLRQINDILDLSKIEAGRMEIRPEAANLTELLRSVVDAVRPMAQNRGIELRVDLDEAPPLWVDPERLRQIFLNLVGNAIKFTERGHVSVTSRIQPEEERLTVTVHDTGVGIAPQDQEHIYQEFRQVDGSATRRHGGTGLGLAITRRLVRLMGGEILLKSDLGRGATFTFWIPVFRARPSVWPVKSDLSGMDPDHPAPTAGSGSVTPPPCQGPGAPEGPRCVTGDRAHPAAVGGPPAPAPAPTDRSGEIEGEGCRRARVLVANHDPVILESMAQGLFREGFEVYPAHGGEEALSLLATSAPDLLVLDLELADLSGFEVLERLTHEKGRVLVPVIVHTRDDLTRAQWAFLEGRADRILQKMNEETGPLVEEVLHLIEVVESRRDLAADPWGRRAA